MLSFRAQSTLRCHLVRKNQLLESIALTVIEGKRGRGTQRKTFMDWISTAYGDQWNSNEILKICREHNEHSVDRQRQSPTWHWHRRIGHLV